MNRYLGIDVGGTFVKFAVMNENGDFLRKFDKVPTVKTSQERFMRMLMDIYDMASACVREETGSELDGIALSAPGFIDTASGIMRTGGSIFSIENLPVVLRLQEHCRCAVTVENDAKCAALAELWKGSLAGCKLGVVLIIGTAIGGAIVYENQVLQGAHFMSGEFSYIMTNADQPMEDSKLLARQGGVSALLEIAAAKTGMEPSALTSEDIFREALAGNGVYLSALQAYAERIAVQVLNLQATLDPEKIAIGGGISEQPLLLELLREGIKQHSAVYPHKLPSPVIDACRYYNDANLIGALYHHLTATTQEA